MDLRNATVRLAYGGGWDAGHAAHLSKTVRRPADRAAPARLAQFLPGRGGASAARARDAPPPRAQVPTSYTKLENFMKQQGKAYLVSDGPTVADFHMWEMMDQHERMAAKTGAPSPLGNFGTLRELYERIRAEPRLAGYFGSAAYALPQNNKSAAYGNTVDDGR